MAVFATTDDDCDNVFECIQETPLAAECSARERLKAFKAEKKRLEDEMKRLDDSIHRAQAEYSSYRNRRLSRAANLPPEILATIFVIAYRHSPCIQLVVSHVCSLWREVALGTSFLWTNIKIYTARDSDSLDVYVERSCTCKVDLTIDSCCAEPEAIYGMWRRLDEKNILERCRSLTIIAKSRRIHLVLHHLKHQSMLVLESLSIHIKSPGVEYAIPPLPTGILSGGAPQLRFLQTQGYSLRHTYLPPLTGLTTLHIHRNSQYLWTDETFVLFLKQMPSLERLSLEGEPVLDGIYTDDISLPTLRELRLRLFPRDKFPSFWCNIIAPNLETLHLYDCDEYSVEIDHADSLTFPKLRHLIIESSEPEVYWPDEPLMLRKLSFFLPSVKHLTCINNLRIVYQELRDPSVWSGIESVRFCAQTNQDMGLAELLDMLMSRDKTGRPIPMVCVPNRPPSFPSWVLKSVVASLKIIDRPAQWPEWVTL